MMKDNDFHCGFSAAGLGMSETRDRLALPRFPRRHALVRELPVVMDEPGRGAGYLPVIQLIKDWNNEPGSRTAMIDEGPPAGTDAVTAAKIAVVVHALCDRDEHPIPDWVMRARSPQETTLVPGIDLRSWFGRRMRARAPAACHYHRVYFSVENLVST